MQTAYATGVSVAFKRGDNTFAIGTEIVRGGSIRYAAVTTVDRREFVLYLERREGRRLSQGEIAERILALPSAPPGFTRRCIS